MAIIDSDEAAKKFGSGTKELKEIQVNADVFISGKKTNFSYLKLDQVYSEHHHFEIKIPFEVLKPATMESPHSKIDLMGEVVSIHFTHGEQFKDTYSFKGIITEIEIVSGEGQHGFTLIKGASPTILLERGKRFDVYSEMTLHRIFELLSETSRNGKLDFVNKPNYDAQVDFQIQYNESDWEFIKRLCYLYGQNIFYSGSELAIGDFSDNWDAVTLTYDREISQLSLSSKLLPNTFQYHTYNPENNDTIERESKNKLGSGNGYVDKAFEKGKNLVTDNTPDLPLENNSFEMGVLEGIVNARQSQIAIKSLYINGISKTFKSTIGRRINVEIPKGMSAVSGYGSYLVVRSTHIIDQNHRYTNTFEAVPDTLKHIALNEPLIPAASTLEAKVVKTDDPKNQGRVKVDFPFKTYSYSSWLRVMTPDGGLTTGNQKNRGLVFIPEVGTSVIVDFQMSNPAYPFVAGALFHGANGEGGGESNCIKSIITRSGIEIVFNDNNRSLHIQDGNGCVWDMDGKGNISVKAPTSITLETGEMKISATKNLSIDIGGNFSTNVGKANNTFANSSKSMITDAYNVYSGHTLISTKGNTIFQSDSISAYGMQKVTLHSDKMVTANSLGRMSMKSAKTLAMTTQTDKAELVNHDEISVAIVQFRCKSVDLGFYGFDNFYIAEGDSYYQNKRKPFEAHLENGVLSQTILNGATTINEYPTKTEALTALKNLYNILPIMRKTPATAGQETEYYVPRLAIYPSTVDRSKAINPGCAPLSSVTMDIFIEILEEIDKIEVEYKKDYFDVSEITLTDKTPCAKKQIEDAVTITCKKEFSRKEEIKVWAYPKSIEGSPSGESPKYLAGKLIVYPNDSTRRKKQNVVLVCVDTNWEAKSSAPMGEKGVITRFADQNLQSVFNQVLIEGSVLSEPAAAHVPLADKNAGRTDFNLDVTNNPDFQKRTVTRAGGQIDVHVGKFIYHMNTPNAIVNGSFYGSKVGLFIMKHYPITGSTDLNVQPNKELYTYLRGMFDRKYPKYAGTMAVFCFGEDLPTNKNLGGLALGLNNNSALVFGDNGEPVIAHEVLHIMGLGHSFRNEAGVTLTKEQKFVFKQGETNNLMDYGKIVRVGGREVSFPSGNVLWHWQWEIANARLKV